MKVLWLFYDTALEQYYLTISITCFVWKDKTLVVSSIMFWFYKSVKKILKTQKNSKDWAGNLCFVFGENNKLCWQSEKKLN